MKISEIFINKVLAQSTGAYESLSGIESQIEGASSGNLPEILNGLFIFGVSLAGALAVIMLVVGGVQYMTSEALSMKEEGKKRMTSAIWGLLLVLFAYLILYTINPDLLKLDFTSNLPNPADNAFVLNQNVMNQYLFNEYGLTPVENNQGLMSLGNIDANAYGYSSGSGLATNFGYNDPMDSGFGSPYLNTTNNGLGINTNNTSLLGAALPESQIRSSLGITGNTWADWAPARKAGVLVSNGTRTELVPLVDVGPGSEPISRGVVIDETYALNQLMGGDGPRDYVIIPNAYPDR